MTSVAQFGLSGTFVALPRPLDAGPVGSSCAAVMTPPLRCQKKSGDRKLSGLSSMGVPGWTVARGSLTDRSSSFMGLGRRWRQATADCRCKSSGVQMSEPSLSEPSLYKGLSARLIKTFGMAELEARKLKYATTGTEALLMGMLTEGTSKAARFLRTKGVTLYAVKQETVKLLGKGDMYYNPPEHPPVTEPAKKALEAAHSYRKTLSGGEGEVTTEHMLLGLLDQKAATAAQVLKNVGIEDSAYDELKQLAAGQPATAV